MFHHRIYLKKKKKWNPRRPPKKQLRCKFLKTHQLVYRSFSKWDARKNMVLEIVRTCVNFEKPHHHCVLFEFVTSFLIDRRQNFSSGWVNKKKVWFLKWTMTFAFISDKNHQHHHPIIHTLCSTMSKSPTFCWKKCSKYVSSIYYTSEIWSDEIFLSTWFSFTEELLDFKNFSLCSYFLDDSGYTKI